MVLSTFCCGGEEGNFCAIFHFCITRGTNFYRMPINIEIGEFFILRLFRSKLTAYRLFTVPKVEIVDERGVSVSDKFYKEGSIIELRCVISRVPQPSGQVVWTHAGRHLNYDTKRGGIR